MSCAGSHGSGDIALAHDVLGARAGGERVLLALAQIYPLAPIHTLLYEPTATFAALRSHTIKPSWLQRSSWLREHYRQTLPVAAATYRAGKIDADVTICSSSGLSHHTRTTGAKIVYCHTPARWLHDSTSYLSGFGRVVRSSARVVAPGFRAADRRAMRSADKVLANSHQVANEIRSVYDVDAIVVPPCSPLDLDGPTEAIPGVEPGFVLSPTRPLGYKRLDVLVDAAKQLPDRQVVQIGEGPHRQQVTQLAPSNFRSLGSVNDAQLRWAYRNAEVVALTCAEDFGLVPLEAAAHGVHTVAPNARGLLDHDTSMMTPYPFADHTALVAAIEAAPKPLSTLQPERLGVDRFTRSICNVVAEFQ